jgi:hypothetical protein
MSKLKIHLTNFDEKPRTWSCWGYDPTSGNVQWSRKIPWARIRNERTHNSIVHSPSISWRPMYAFRCCWGCFGAYGISHRAVTRLDDDGDCRASDEPTAVASDGHSRAFCGGAACPGLCHGHPIINDVHLKGNPMIHKQITVIFANGNGRTESIGWRKHKSRKFITSEFLSYVAL